MMALDFLWQTTLALLFCGGLAGIGLLMLQVFGFRERNVFFGLGMAYFVSLCLYTIGAVGTLFIFPWKILTLQVFTVAYGLLSWTLIIRKYRNRFKDIPRTFRAHRWFFFMVTVATALFFLQIYRTSILDEWLHRPIVKSFVENGVFPLVNPYSPGSDYIHTYHYGTQLIGAALALVSQIDVSSALDLFKLGVFLATLLLFNGILLQWVANKYLALAGAVLVLFSGSSFFLLDSFTASHLMSFGGLGLPAGQRWPINAPLSYILTGITWANIPLAIALGVLMEHIFLKRRTASTGGMYVLLAAIFVGFFLISELFAVIVLVGLLIACGMRFQKNRALLLRGAFGLGTLFVLTFSGVYFTGGIVGDMIAQTVRWPLARWSVPTATPLPNANESPDTSLLAAPEPSFLSLKDISEWGYPSEKRVLVPWDIPLYYLRSVLLEVLILVLWGYLLTAKRVKITEYPVLIFFIAAGLVGPFLFTTKFGDLNFAKTTTLSFVLLHLFGFYLLSRVQLWRKTLWSVFLVLLVFGSISGFFMGPNIQWHIISGKGKEQYCSQNPRCYKGPLVDMLRQFETEVPGLKRVGVDPENVRKVIDLTQAYVYSVHDPRVDYVIETPEQRKSETDSGAPDRLLYEAAGYRIWKVN